MHILELYLNCVLLLSFKASLPFKFSATLLIPLSYENQDSRAKLCWSIMQPPYCSGHPVYHVAVSFMSRRAVVE